MTHLDCYNANTDIIEGNKACIQKNKHLINEALENAADEPVSALGTIAPQIQQEQPS